MTAGGWRDSTRIAAGDPELWTQILSHNRDNLLTSLEKLEKSLAAFRSGLERKSGAAVIETTHGGQTDSRCCGKLTFIRRQRA